MEDDEAPKGFCEEVMEGDVGGSGVLGLGGCGRADGVVEDVMAAKVPALGGGTLDWLALGVLLTPSDPPDPAGVLVGVEVRGVAVGGPDDVDDLVDEVGLPLD